MGREFVHFQKLIKENITKYCSQKSSLAFQTEFKQGSLMCVIAFKVQTNCSTDNRKICNAGREMFIFQDTTRDLLGLVQVIRLLKDFEKRAKKTKERDGGRTGSCHLKEGRGKEHGRKVSKGSRVTWPTRVIFGVESGVDLWDVQLRKAEREKPGYFRA